MICRHFNEDPKQGCGGCQYQHFDIQVYQKFKEDQVLKLLSQQGIKNFTLEPSFMVPEKTRWRARLHAIKTNQKLELGFHKKRSHHVIDMHQCRVLKPELFSLLEPIRILLEQILQFRDRLSLQITVLDQQIGILFLRDHPFSLENRQIISQFAHKHKIARIAQQIKTQEPEIIISLEPFDKKISDILVPFPVGGFLQSSHESEIRLQEIVAKEIFQYKPKKIADLFCGIGTFSFPFAKLKQVKKIIGYDSFLPAINAYNHAVKNHDLSRLTAVHRNLFELPLTRKELNEFDMVIVDPPRKGMLQQAHHLSQSNMPLLVYVSCYLKSFARDSRVLMDAGYKLKTVTMVDQFIWSDHIEVVGVFTKEKSAPRKRRF